MPAERAHIKACLEGLRDDKDTLELIDAYLRGQHRDPYIPAMADAEYKLLVQRAITNLIPTVVNLPVQSLWVDGVRSGEEVAGAGADPASMANSVQKGKTVSAQHWAHWQRSHLDARQAAIHRSAIAYGHSFALTELNDEGEVVTRGLSPMRTFAIYNDPANDMDPVGVLTIMRYPAGEEPGLAHFWDATTMYEVTYEEGDYDKFKVDGGVSHGATKCPVTRFAASVDLEGRTQGVVLPMLSLQDRVNQTVLDLLVTQSGGAHRVRWATGMAPPVRKKAIQVEQPDGTVAEEWIDELDTNGNPIPLKMKVGASDFIIAESPDTRFGDLPGNSLDGYISSLNQVVQQFTALSQTPPHYLLGQIANLSAEALQAAEMSLARKIHEFKTVFGESWERVFRIAAELGDDAIGMDDYAAEVMWRDMDAQALSKTVDALGKAVTMLGVPHQAMWPRIPGVTQQELVLWEELASQNPEAQFASSATKAAALLSGGERTSPQQSQSASAPAGRMRRAWSS